MTRISGLMILPPVLFFGLAGVFIWGMARPDPSAIPSVLIGQEAPAVTAAGFPGAPGFTTDTLRDGKVKIVNFWASWCGPCRAEHPGLMALSKEGVPVYGVNYRDRPGDAQAFLAELGNPYTAIGTDEKARMGFEWGVTSVPESFVVDGEGRVIKRITGPLVERVISSDLRPALRQAAGG